MLFLGKTADATHAFADVRGYRIGIGPLGSGTDHLARQLFGLPEFRTLGVTLTNVYCAIEGTEIVVLTIWGAPRGRGPKL